MGGCSSDNMDDEQCALAASVQYALRKLGLERMEILEFYAYFLDLELNRQDKVDLDLFLMRMQLPASKLTVKIFNSMDAETVLPNANSTSKLFEEPQKLKHKHAIGFQEFVMYVTRFVTMDETEMSHFTFDLYSNTSHHSYLDGDRDMDSMTVADLKLMMTSIHGADHAESLKLLFIHMVGADEANQYTVINSAAVAETKPTTDANIGTGAGAGADADAATGNIQKLEYEIEKLLAHDEELHKVKTGLGLGRSSNALTVDQVSDVHAGLLEKLEVVPEKMNMMSARVTRAQFVEHIVEFPSLLYPMFSLQATLKRQIMGYAFWSKVQNRVAKAKLTSEYLELFGAAPSKHRGAVSAPDHDSGGTDKAIIPVATARKVNLPRRMWNMNSGTSIHAGRPSDAYLQHRAETMGLDQQQQGAAAMGSRSQSVANTPHGSIHEVHTDGTGSRHHTPPPTRPPTASAPIGRRSRANSFEASEKSTSISTHHTHHSHVGGRRHSRVGVTTPAATGTGTGTGAGTGAGADEDDHSVTGHTRSHINIHSRHNSLQGGNGDASHKNKDNEHHHHGGGGGGGSSRDLHREHSNHHEHNSHHSHHGGDGDHHGHHKDKESHNHGHNHGHGHEHGHGHGHSHSGHHHHTSIKPAHNPYHVDHASLVIAKSNVGHG